MGVISGHQLSTFSSPVNATSPIDANTVRGNDNTIKTAYNAHDADTTIHLQNGAISARPAASTAGQTWLASDTGAVVGSYDTGSAWVPWNYVTTNSTGAATITSTTSPILTLAYDGTHTATFGVSSAGLLTINATTTVTITPATTITGAVTLSAALTYGGVTLSNAVTGTGNMVLSASPTLTGTLTAAAASYSGAVSALSLSADAAANSNLILLKTSGTTRWIHYLPTTSTYQIFDQTNGVAALTITAGAAPAVALNGALSGITTLATTGNAGLANPGISFNAVVTIGNTTPVADNSSAIQLLGTTLGHNWQIDNNRLVGDVLSFTPSTAVGGSTFTTPVFKIASSGAVTFTAGLSGITTLAGTGAISGFTSCVLSSTLTAASANTVTGSTVVNTGAGTVTLFTVPGAGVYVVSAYNTAGAVFASFIVADDGNGIFGAPTTISATSGFGAAASSHAFQINNTSGTNRTLTWSYLRIN